jgi:Bacterial archaeo-eukaryotic release factor family 3
MIDQATLAPLLEPAECALSLYLPIDPEQRDIRVPAARLRELIDEAGRRLVASGLEPRQAEALLAPAHRIERETDFARHRDHGLVLFLTAARAPQVFTIPAPLPHLQDGVVTAGRHFHLRPLLGLLAHNRRFHILGLSAGNVRLLSATPFAWTVTPLNALPVHLQAAADSLLTTEGGAKQSQQDEEALRKELLLEDLGNVADAVSAALGTDTAPLVLAAEPKTAGHFTKVAQLRQLLSETVAVNPFALSDAELHARAVALMQPILDAERNALLEQVNARLGTAEPNVAIRLEEILTASHEGRVEAVIVAQDNALWGRFTPGAVLVAHGTQAAGDEDLLNQAAVETMRHGGQAFLLPHDRLPRQAPAVATLRY